MPHDQSLGFAQIILAVVVVTLSLPALTFADEPIRHVLNRRVRRWPVLALITASLVFVLALLSVSGLNIPKWVPWAKALMIALLAVFALLWIAIIGTDVRVRLVKSIGRHMRRPLRRRLPFSDSDVADLISLGENLGPGEKTAVINAIGALCRTVQESPGYSGCELHDLIEGLRSVLINSERRASDQNYQRAVAVLADCWIRLVRCGLTAENDASVVREAACVLGETAMVHRSDTIVLRCMVVMPNVEILYRIGIAALRQQRFRIVIAAVNRLESSAAEQKPFPPQLLALTAYLCLMGGSAAEYARGVGRRLGYDDDRLHAEAAVAATRFAARGDFAAADAVSTVWRR
jgi:hypothetical protein